MFARAEGIISWFYLHRCFADTGSNPVPQKGEKKKEKRKFGILELATKEFEDESEVRQQRIAQLYTVCAMLNTLIVKSLIS